MLESHRYNVQKFGTLHAIYPIFNHQKEVGRETASYTDNDGVERKKLEFDLKSWIPHCYSTLASSPQSPNSCASAADDLLLDELTVSAPASRRRIRRHLSPLPLWSEVANYG
ncbi:Uncharacterized protein Adt_37306 [Abeliophyllum distichum]|uniref:Uncharacterized protein n=1 Tax=Abeliophyllum distichum TaxID=126358 RepID=A0ABD1QK18_9LAMI